MPLPPDCLTPIMKALGSIGQPLAVATAQHTLTTWMTMARPLGSESRSFTFRRVRAQSGLNVELTTILVHRAGRTSSQNLAGQPPSMKHFSRCLPAASVRGLFSMAPKFICISPAPGEEMHLPGPSRAVPSTPEP